MANYQQEIEELTLQLGTGKDDDLIMEQISELKKKVNPGPAEPKSKTNCEDDDFCEMCGS